MSIGDLIAAVHNGGPALIALLLLELSALVSMWMTGKIISPTEVVFRDQLRQAQISDRDKAIDRLATVDERRAQQLERQQDLFDAALGMLRDRALEDRRPAERSM
jgi:hypothetical protein